MAAEAKIRSDNSFTYQFLLPEERTLAGVYTVRVEYLHEAVTTTFVVGEITEAERFQPILTLNQPPPVITRGDIVIFTGLLSVREKPMADIGPSVSPSATGTAYTGSERIAGITGKADM